MGRKNKNKNKMSGSEKTALKTEKKLNARQKKELAALGEDDIEKVVAEIEREEAGRQRVKEAIVEPPSRRVNFTLTPHPFKNELIMLGGEYHDGRQTTVYGDMFFYNITKREWTVMKAPGAPPPRCSHQAIATASQGGELWVFGGEFSSPSESQFYHYRDLWVFRLAEKKWQKMRFPNGPSARSGHRMLHIRKQLIVFGGFHDNLKEYKYFNDVHIFDLESYVWREIETSGIAPTPRSGCILLPTPDNKILVYGGYSREKVKKDVDKGRIHDDMFLLTPHKDDANKYKWTCVRQIGTKPISRCGLSATIVQSNQALMFGGVHDLEDDDDDEENLRGTFYNDLLALDLEKFQWRVVTLSRRKEISGRRRRKEEEENDEESYDDSEQVIPEKPSVVITDDDGIFTVTVGSATSSKTISNYTDGKSSNSCEEMCKYTATFSPSPRIHAGMTVKCNILYLYGGMVEDGDRQYTLNDFYSLNCRKLDEWKTLIADDSSSQVWFDSSSDSEEDNDDESDNDDIESTDINKR